MENNSACNNGTLLTEALFYIEKRQAPEHSLHDYAEAAAELNYKVKRFVTAGGESVVFELADGNILKISSIPLEKEHGLRPFDLPILEKHLVKTKKGTTIQFYIQPQADTDIDTSDTITFETEINGLGYQFSDWGGHQLGWYNKNLVLLDPYAVMKR